MNKNWGTVKSEVINLGFEKSKVYDKNKTAFIEAFNWAQNFIAATVCPVVDSVVIEQQAGTVLYNSYNLQDLTQTDGESVFISLAREKPVFSSKTAYQTLSDYRIEGGINILFKGEYGGSFRVFYNRYPQAITADTPDDHRVEIDYKYANLLPYLMANRLWLDDDMAKAISYWNLYEDMKNQLVQAVVGAPVLAQVIHEGWEV